MRTATTLAVIAVLACAGIAQAQTQPGPPPRRWLGSDGELLPFSTTDEIKDFLSRADVVSTAPLEGGTSGGKRLELELDGVRAGATFKDIDVRRERITIGGQYYRVFRDSTFFEVAAFELGLMLGIDAIPPSVVRRVGGDRGAVQLWIENASRETDLNREGVRPPSPARWHRQRQVMKIFDNLVRNDD